MGDTNVVEVDFGSTGLLVVVSGLEVAGGCVELVGGEGLECALVDGYRQDILLIADLVVPALSWVDLANWLALLFAVVGGTQLDTEVQLTPVVDIQLSNGLVRLGIGRGFVNVNLTNADLTIVLGDAKIAEETVDWALGVPGVRTVLTELAAAVLTVGGTDAFRVVRVTGNLEFVRWAYLWDSEEM